LNAINFFIALSDWELGTLGPHRRENTITVQFMETMSMAKHLQFFGWVAVVVFVFGITGTARAQSSDLVGMLTSQLGVSEEQAAGGSGSLLSFAKDQMSSADFDVISSELPDVSGLIKAAPDAGSSVLGSSSSLLGGSSSSLGDIAGVASTFSDLGMSTDMVNQFVPVVLEYAQTAGSEQAMQILQGALTAF
jgi:hypothetical protein